MKNELYQWMKNLTFFYVLFQAVLQLVPDRQYEKYVRFYMGLLLVILLLTPMFMILGKGEELLKDLQGFYQNEERYRIQRETENLEKYYLDREQKWKEEVDEIYDSMDERM